MEVIRTVGSVMGSIKMLVDLIGKNRELAEAVAAGLKSMMKDFELIRTVGLQKKQQQLQLTPGMELLLQELAYDIDDFIQGLLVPGPCGSFILSAFGVDSRPLLIQRISDFKESMKNLKDELTKSFEAIPASPSSSIASPISYAPEAELVGIQGAKKEIMELLAPRVKPHLGRLSVISILGCSGSGKTALARALYEGDAVTKDFDFKSWIVASDPSSATIVSKILQEVVLASAPNSSPEALHHFKKDKRYLVFVDDVLRETPWKDITNAFSENVMDSRIILTTSVPSVARDYSSGSYEYTMQGLDQENSRKLFRVKFRGMAGYTEEDEYRLGNNDVDIIIDKCDGLPIALISAAECLRRKGPNPVSRDFKQVIQELREGLACCDSAFEEFHKQNGIENTFVEMRRARVEPYEKLLNHGEKECLLYASIFPCGHQINSKSLVRRLIAEGLVPGERDIVKASESVVGDVRECVRKLMDQQMIQPVPIRNYSNVAKRCRVHSIMLQFTIKKAVSRNFVSLIHEDQPLRSATGLVRRLTVQSSTLVQGNECPEGMDLSVLRSLAIFKSRILNFEKCKLVRILDLEGCRGLTPKDLGSICGLLFLKYLSLRNTGIAELPENVKELMFLETLDTRNNQDTQDTVVIKLPVEVLMLPRFAYLFGKFELYNVHSNNRKKLTKFFSEQKSQLHTFGGIAVHETKGLEIVLLVIQDATKLKKVKVWYKDTPSSTGPVMASTPVAISTPELPCAGPLADSSSNAQDAAPATCALVPGGTPGLTSAGPSADSNSNAHDPIPAISTPVANGTPEPIACGRRKGLLTNKKKHFWFFSKRKPSTGPASNPTSNTHDPAPATSIYNGTPGLPCAGPLAYSSNYAQNPAPTISALVAIGSQGLPSAPPPADSSSNAQDPTLAIYTPVANGTAEKVTCARRQGLFMHKKKHFWLFNKWKWSAGPASNPASSTHDPAPATYIHVVSVTPGLPCAASLLDSSSNAQDPGPTISTPNGSVTPLLPSARPSADSSSNAQDPASTISALVASGSLGLPSARPSANSSSNVQDPTFAISTQVANGKPKLVASARKQGLFTNKKKHFWFFSKWKPSAGPASNHASNTHDPARATCIHVATGTPGLPCAASLEDSSSNAQDPVPTNFTPGLPSVGASANSSSNAHDPAPTVSTPVADGELVIPSAGPSADSSCNAQDPAPATCTPVAGGTSEPLPSVSRLGDTIRKRSIGLECVSVDFNGVPNNFLDYIHKNGTISSIKLRKGSGSLPGPDKLGNACNLKKLHLFSTGLKSEDLGALQHLKCLQYLKLAEEGHGLWERVFHVQARGFISLLWLCFESSNSKPPPLKFDQGVKTPLTSLLLLCKGSHPQLEGMSHLAKLNEVILHNSATDDEVAAWKEEAKRHINRPYVEKQQA